MACPTCNRTMQNIGQNNGASVFWCPLCGTVKINTPHDHSWTPAWAKNIEFSIQMHKIHTGYIPYDLELFSVEFVLAPSVERR